MKIPMRALGFLLGCAVACSASAASAQKKTYINPVDVDYRYNW